MIDFFFVVSRHFLVFRFVCLLCFVLFVYLMFLSWFGMFCLVCFDLFVYLIDCCLGIFFVVLFVCFVLFCMYV